MQRLLFALPRPRRTHNWCIVPRGASVWVWWISKWWMNDRLWINAGSNPWTGQWQRPWSYQRWTHKGWGNQRKGSFLYRCFSLYIRTGKNAYFDLVSGVQWMKCLRQHRFFPWSLRLGVIGVYVLSPVKSIIIKIVQERDESELSTSTYCFDFSCDDWQCIRFHMITICIGNVVGLQETSVGANVREWANFIAESILNGVVRLEWLAVTVRGLAQRVLWMVLRFAFQKTRPDNFRLDNRMNDVGWSGCKWKIPFVSSASISFAQIFPLTSNSGWNYYWLGCFDQQTFTDWCGHKSGRWPCAKVRFINEVRCWDGRS